MVTNLPGDETPASSGASNKIPVTTPTGETVEFHSAVQSLQRDREVFTPPDEGA